MDQPERSDLPPSPSLKASEEEPSAWEKLTAKRLGQMASAFHVKLDKVFHSINLCHDQLGDVESLLKEFTSVAKTLREAKAARQSAPSADGLLPGDQGEAARAQLSLPLCLPAGITTGSVSPSEIVHATVEALNDEIRRRSRR